MALSINGFRKSHGLPHSSHQDLNQRLFLGNRTPHSDSCPKWFWQKLDEFNDENRWTCMNIDWTSTKLDWKLMNIDEHLMNINDNNMFLTTPTMPFFCQLWFPEAMPWGWATAGPGTYGPAVRGPRRCPKPRRRRIQALKWKMRNLALKSLHLQETHRKHPFLIVKSMVSCNFFQQPIQWLMFRNKTVYRPWYDFLDIVFCNFVVPDSYNETFADSTV